MLYRYTMLLITIVDETVDIGTSNVSFVEEKNYVYVSDVILHNSFGNIILLKSIQADMSSYTTRMSPSKIISVK